MKRAALLVPLLMFAAFVALAVFGLGRPNQRTIESKMVGQPVPDFELAGFDALHPGLQTTDLKQGTVTLVNVFASWCIPCRVEAPQLKALADKGIVVHAVAVRDTPAALRAFLDEHGDPFRRIGMDIEGKAMIALGASGVPETFLVDESGVIRRQYIGEIRPAQVAEVLRDIDEVRK